jgi:hypothetical protein
MFKLFKKYFNIMKHKFITKTITDEQNEPSGFHPTLENNIVRMKMIKKKSIQYLLLITLSFIIVSCSTLGSRFIYQDESFQFDYLNKIGYTDLTNLSLIDKIDTSYSELFNNSIEKYLSSQNIKFIKIENIDFNNIENNSNLIQEICQKNNLNGIVIPKLEFLMLKYNKRKNKYIHGTDNKVDMKFYDLTGKLVFHSRHNTYYGNSYWKNPKPEMTIPDGAVGALKKIIEESKSSLQQRL